VLIVVWTSDQSVWSWRHTPYGFAAFQVSNMSDAELESKSLQRIKTRERIVAAARDIVTREGYAALSMRRLAGAVAYSPAALYMHFASRDEIAHILRREALAALALALDEPPVDAADIHRVQALGRAWLNFARTQPALYLLGFIERLSEAPGDPAAPVLHSVRRALNHNPGETGDQSVPTYGLDARAEAVMAVLHGLATLQLLQPAMLTVPIEGLLQLSVKSLLRGWPGLRG